MQPHHWLAYKLLRPVSQRVYKMAKKWKMGQPLKILGDHIALHNGKIEFDVNGLRKTGKIIKKLLKKYPGNMYKFIHGGGLHYLGKTYEVDPEELEGIVMAC